MKNKIIRTIICGLICTFLLTVINSYFICQIYGILKTNIQIELRQTKLIHALADSVWGKGDTH